jgi:hypothetical protein
MLEPLSVEVEGDQIIITQPWTSFAAIYGKREGFPGIVLLSETTDPDAEREAILQFRADAFAAATNKARELGWIV